MQADFSDRRFWASPDLDKMLELLEQDYLTVYQKDPFVTELCMCHRDKRNRLENFKSQYWPSLVNAIEEQNVYIRSLCLDLMVEDETPEVKSKLWGHFEDSYPICRWIMINKFKSDNRNRLFHELFLIISSDPVRWVRKAASKRIHKDFSDMLSYEFNEFKTEEQYHLLDILDINSTADRKIMEKGIEAPNDFSFACSLLLRDSGYLEDMIHQKSGQEMLNKLGKRAYLDMMDLVDMESIESCEQAISILTWLNQEEQKDAFLPLVLMYSNLQGTKKQKEELFHLFLKAIKKASPLIAAQAIEELLTVEIHDKALIESLLKQIKKPHSPYLTNCILDLLDNDEFVLNPLWIKTISAILHSQLKSLMRNILDSEDFNHLKFQKAFQLLIQVSQEESMEIILRLLARQEKEKPPSYMLQDLFDQACKLSGSPFTAALELLWDTEPELYPQLCPLTPMEILKKKLPLLQEQYCHYHGKAKIDILNVFYEADTDYFLQEWLHVSNDPSREIQDQIQIWLKQEKKNPLAAEWM